MSPQANRQSWRDDVARAIRVVPALWLVLTAGAVAGPAHSTVDDHLATMTLSLTDTRPYRFVLAYHGPNVPYRGMLCYHFAGYNETCLKPDLDWLTPATTIELYAPGGVPRDLLEGYMMLVRYPSLSERRFRYALSGDD